MRAPTLIWSNLLISMAAVSASIHAFSPCQSTFCISIAIGIGAWTWFAYSLHRWVKFKRPGRMHATERGWLVRNKRGLFLGGGLALLLSGLPLLVAFSVERWDWLVWAVLAGGISLVYAGSPKSRFALRELPGAKLWAISTAWAFSTAALPMAFQGYSMADPALWAATGARFLVICALTIPFDIRDIALDDPAMRTLPQIIGPRAATMLALSMLAGAGAIHSISHGHPSTLAVYALMAAVILWAPDDHPHRRYGMLDATLLLLGPAAWIFG
jgi:hypothetical protein